MKIVITGTPGTGKTKVALELAHKMGIELVDLKDFVNSHNLFKIEKGEKTVDIARLKDKLLPILQSKPDYIVEGHLACEFRIPADFVFVLRTHMNKLRARLEARRYAKKKLEENLEAELLDYCVQRVENVYGIEPLELDTSRRPVPKCAEDIRKAIREKKKKLDSVDYSHELKTYLRLRK